MCYGHLRSHVQAQTVFVFMCIERDVKHTKKRQNNKPKRSKKQNFSSVGLFFGCILSGSTKCCPNQLVTL